MIRSARGLRPIHTPITTPSSITIAVPTSVEVRVAMLSSHSPVAMINARQIAEIAAARTLPSTAEIATITANTSHHGDCTSSASSGLMNSPVTAFLAPLVIVKKLSCTHSVAVDVPTEILLPISTGGNSAAQTYVRESHTAT